MTTLQILKDSKAVIETKGWWKNNDPWYPHGECAATAVQHTIGGRPRYDDTKDYEDTMAVLAFFLRANGIPQGDNSYVSTAAWNDAKDTTQEMVMRAFDVAIEAAEELEG